MTQPTVGEQLAVINTKLDLLIEQRTDHEVRIRALEKFKWVILGTAVAAGPVWSSISPHLG
jgi:hypothetical protein